MKPGLPIGISDFRRLREQGLYYVDKTAFIRDLIDMGPAVLLFPRPRRFGKTLNLSTLQWYFEKQAKDAASLFEGLTIWESGGPYRAHFQRYPVIFLTFKDVKEATFAACFASIAKTIADEFGRHGRLLQDGLLAPHERASFERILERKADPIEVQASLRDLSAYLGRAAGEPVVILIDEYDTPIHSGFHHGYYDEVTGFFRNFLSGGLKDNKYLYKGVLTGILRVARESIFSGLNNILVQSILHPDFSTAFGFTESEVEALLAHLGHPESLAEVQRWYNGYSFGGTVIYNPWSILNYAQTPQTGFRPYWVFTSSEDVLRNLVLEQGHLVTAEMETLLAGGTIRKEIEEHIVLREIGRSPEAVWSLLLFSGYLTARQLELRDGHQYGDLSIPNRELRYVFEKSIRSWAEAGVGGSERLSSMLQAMLRGDVESFEGALSQLVARTFSYHDTGGREPERVYQAFVLGMLVLLGGEYQVRSNRESGYGRYDVAVIPRQPGRPGVIFEFKQVTEAGEAAVEQALATALEQIEQRDYATELRAAGATPILCYSVVFDGKRVRVRFSKPHSNPA